MVDGSRSYDDDLIDYMFSPMMFADKVSSYT